MKKEIIWNLCLLFFGVFTVFVLTMNIVAPGVLPGWHTTSLFPPFAFTSKILLGLLVGSILLFFRYLILAVLSIVNKDLKLVVLLMGYATPIFMVMVVYHFSMERTMDSVFENRFPIQLIKKEVSHLRNVGMFKAYANHSDNFVTELALGRAITAQDGWTDASEYWNSESNQVKYHALLRLDKEKVWQMDDTEFVLEGNRSYEEVIEEFGKISEGNFNPSEINETWESNNKVKITFEHEGHQHVIYPRVLRDWADMNGVIGYLNNEILDTVDYQFYYGSGGDVFIIGLMDAERKELSKLTGINFEII